MHDLASFSKRQLILLAFKGFFSPYYYLPAILFEGNELTTNLQALVNLGDSYVSWIKQLQCSNSSAEICLSGPTKHLSHAMDIVDSFVCGALVKPLVRCCTRQGSTQHSRQGRAWKLHALGRAMH